MMQFKYENSGSTSFLVYAMEEHEELDNVGLGMIRNNNIPNILPIAFTQMDLTRYLRYNISSKVSLQSFLSGIVSRKRVLTVFGCICDAHLAAEEYLFNNNLFVMDPEYIFVDVSTGNTSLVYLATVRDEEQLNLAGFFKNIIVSIKSDPNDDCSYIAQLLNYLNSSDHFSLQGFRTQVYDLMKEKVVKTAPIPTVEKPMYQTSDTGVAPQESKAHPVQPVISQPIQSVASSSVVSAQNDYAPVVPTGGDVINTPESEHDEKKMSALYLLRHYSKENAEIYKAQKNKEGEAAKAAPKKKGGRDKKSDKGTHQVSFVVPGAPQEDVEFKISSQSASVQPVVPTTSASQPVVSVKPVSQPVAPITPGPQVSPIVSPVQPVTTATKPTGFGETTVLSNTSAIGETTVLSGTAVVVQKKPYLIRKKNAEKIPLDKPVFRIGKERSYVDYFIGDNPAISRSHANIVTRDTGYYVVDTNSTNHTYVNGVMIPSNEEHTLESGTVIRFGNEDFEFKLL